MKISLQVNFMQTTMKLISSSKIRHLVQLPGNLNSHRNIVKQQYYPANDYLLLLFIAKFSALLSTAVDILSSNVNFMLQWWRPFVMQIETVTHFACKNNDINLNLSCRPKHILSQFKELQKSVPHLSHLNSRLQFCGHELNCSLAVADSFFSLVICVMNSDVECWLKINMDFLLCTWTARTVYSRSTALYNSLYTSQ